MKKIIISIIVLSFLLSCSSAPRKNGSITEIKNRASEYAEFGNKYYNEAKYQQSLKFFFLALDLNVSVDNEEGIATSYNSIGKLYTATGNNTLAEEYYRKAYNLSVSIENNQIILKSSNNLGEFFLRKGEFTDALNYFKEASNLLDKNGSPELAIVYHNIGTTYKHLGEYKSALESLNTALEINLKQKHYEEMAANYYMIASIYSKQNNFDQAINHALLALKNDKKVEHSLGIAKDLLALGLINRKNGKIEEAYTYFKKSFLVYETLNYTSELIKLLYHLEKSALDLEKNDEAALYRKTLTNLEKTL